MLLKRGNNNDNVKVLQKFLNINADGIFGRGTENAVMQWQRSNSLPADGKVGPNTIREMGLNLTVEKESEEFDEKYKDFTIQGSTFPDKPLIDYNRITFSKEIEEEYIPALEQAMGDQPKGFKLLCTIMAHKEGFKHGTRSYRTNNPGNIGNTDSGKNKSNLSLTDGILLQKDYINKIVNGDNKSYPMGKDKVIPPYFSKEIAKHSKTYGMSPYVPGYDFIFTGQLDQFVKIYSTGARAGNGYLSMIISFFKIKGIILSPESKIQDIIQIS